MGDRATRTTSRNCITLRQFSETDCFENSPDRFAVQQLTTLIRGRDLFKQLCLDLLKTSSIKYIIYKIIDCAFISA